MSGPENEVRPSEPRAGSQAGLNGPGGSPPSGLDRDDARLRPDTADRKCAFRHRIFSDCEILDACCGGRMWWWDKAHPLAVYVDKRVRPAGTIPQKPLWKVAPDVLADFRDLPFDDGAFQLVVFDPPHQVRSRAGTGINAEQYGAWEVGERDEALRLGFVECWRVLAPGGTLVFKWAGRVTEVQAVFPAEPVVGTRPRGRKEGPAWVIFYKPLEERAMEAAA